MLHGKHLRWVNHIKVSHHCILLYFLSGGKRNHFCQEIVLVKLVPPSPDIYFNYSLVKSELNDSLQYFKFTLLKDALQYTNMR